ncbi:OmpA family protein [Rhizobium beringeri]|uniref:OmpA family protein n=1 Tax=Rhizobium beringeri TaxID=3019934 RepID=A0ABY1XUI9_9HYPH|nr:MULTISPECIES: OmpA family protein [Rhizobium]NKL65232.1 OmpA family protein [Rhizobium leguminosarum bv. viciae]TBC73427.1 OmpA family protein [Rhizobium leguminosarum]TBC94599.1 OmpA family protein [Rhizobium leguminosarum]TBD05130.1 OmpA family protein [Rhizobium leguminosarum]TBE71301.1 OmpA family protein [Rhizobium beringeri]
MGMKSRLFASAAFPLLSLSLALQPAAVMAAVRDVATQASPVRQAEQGSFQVAQDAPSEEELLKKKRKQKEEAPAEQAPAAEKPAQQEAPAEKPKAERKEAPAPEPKAEPEPPKAEAAPKEEPAPQPEGKPERKAKSEAQPEAKPEAEPQQEQQQPVTQDKPKKPKKQETQQAEPEQQPAAKEAQPETEQAQPEAKPEGGKRDKGQDKAQGRDKGKGKAEKEAQPAAPEAVTPTAEPAKPEAKPEEKPAAEAPAEKKPAKGETAAPADKAPTDKTTEDKAAAPEAAPAEKPKDGTAAKPAGEQPAAPATDTAQPLPDASGGQQVEQAIPAPEKASPEELERRKKIAADPAKSSETVVLPVENGGAVLDSDKDADRSKGREGRRDRDRQRADSQEVKVPTSDADAQALSGAKAPAPVKLEAVTREKGRKLDERPQFVRPDGARFDDRGDDSRVIIQYDNRTIVRGDDDRRFLRDGERPSYEELSGDRYRETITRPEGYRIVTIRNRYGDIIQRSRVDARGREDVLYYSQDLYDDPDRDYFEDPGADLPPMRLRVPLSDYIIDTRSDPNRDYYEFLSEPPVEPVERVYSLDEVKYSARIRDKVRRIDLDTITFATGSADIPMTQARTLRKVADAISQVLEKDPSETFLIEGHTDAVGSDQSNLLLSDQRAESVANVLSDVYGIAPENLATQGYGEQYLKVNTSAPEQENRRVTIRRVTALVRPVAANK